jgi:prepilin-type N-terminal cleavage/methylation domain-containing protein
MRVESRNIDFGLRISDCGLTEVINPQSAIRNPQLPRSGMTLVELLVVIVILTTLVAAAIPLMSPAGDDRRLREASRGLNTFITGAQTRAVAVKRPFGIALKRLSQDTDDDNNPFNSHDDNGVCLEVFYVEQPPPFSGFSATSSAMVAIDNGPFGGVGQVLVRFVVRGNQTPPNGDTLPPGWDADPLPHSTVRPGDVVEVGGNQYRLTDDSELVDGFYSPISGNPDGTLVAVPLNDTGQMINVRYDNTGAEIANGDDVVPFYTHPAPYKILRQPAPTSDEPYQLPEGTAIDLRASGVGIDDYFYVPDLNDNSQGIIILFTPEGRVARVSYSQQPPDSSDILDSSSQPVPYDQSVVDNVFLLVGKRENIPAPPATTDPTLDPTEVAKATTDEARAKLREPINWLSTNSRWIVIGSMSGRVVTIENGFVDLNQITTLSTPPPSTEELRTEQVLAAREFTQEMANVGGR